jgi:predicted dehydrogenase
VLRSLEGVELLGLFDTDSATATAAAAEYNCRVFASLEELAAEAEAAIVAIPTVHHARVGCALLDAGLDLLIEKPIAADVDSARELVEAAARGNRILQVGHLERFNPAVEAVSARVTLPLFFEVHRMSVFTPRSLDVDVVADLMIHDIDVILSLTGMMPSEIRAAGLSVLSDRVDIANVRLAFPSGCVANLTASRVSTERVRKLRLFQPHQYISMDYTRQDVFVTSVTPDRQVRFEPLAVSKGEPLAREVASFIECCKERKPPRVDGVQALRAIQVAEDIARHISEHSRLVEISLKRASC